MLGSRIRYPIFGPFQACHRIVLGLTWSIFGIQNSQIQVSTASKPYTARKQQSIVGYHCFGCFGGIQWWRQVTYGDLHTHATAQALSHETVLGSRCDRRIGRGHVRAAGSFRKKLTWLFKNATRTMQTKESNNLMLEGTQKCYSTFHKNLQGQPCVFKFGQPVKQMWRTTVPLKNAKAATPDWARGPAVSCERESIHLGEVYIQLTACLNNCTILYCIIVLYCTVNVAYARSAFFCSCHMAMHTWQNVLWVLCDLASQACAMPPHQHPAADASSAAARAPKKRLLNFHINM